MKKNLVWLSCVILFFSARAQSFELGARYLAVSNWFFNKNVTNSNIPQNYAAIYSYSYGLHIAYNFNEHVGLEANILIAQLSQSYNGSFQGDGVLPEGQVYYDQETYKSSVTVNLTQIPLFFRFLSGNGAYAEIGPELGIISDANYTATYTGGPSPSSGLNVPSYYANSYVAGVLSFGNNIRLHHKLFFNINLRFSYDFTDLKGLDAFGQNLNDQALYSGNQPFYSGYKPTHAVSASFGVGLLYRFGHDF